jgi:DNA polymerase-3 subunit delta
MIYLFHGDDEFGKAERINALKTGLGELVDINTTELDGRSVTYQELQHHCDVPPFLGEYRLVIVSNLLSRLVGSRRKGEKVTGASADFMAWLGDYLPTVPATTQLVFSEDKKLPKSNQAMKALVQLGEGSEVVEFSAPSVRGNGLERWVVQHAQKTNVRLAPGVATDLANFIGPDLRLIDSEMAKLAVYAGDRQVTQDDVRLLVPYAQDANIFNMVDALGHRRTAQAFRLLAQLRNEGAHPLYLLTMIVRQYRILVQVKELMEQGLNRDSIASRIKLHVYPTQKAMAQARQYSSQQLISIYDRLLDTDAAIKTGRMEANLALDILVVELARA